MRPFLLLSLCITMASANLLNQYILDMATRNMDPATRSIMRSSLGSMLDMDMGTGGYGTGGYGSFGGSGTGFGSSFAMNPLYDPPQFGPPMQGPNMIGAPSPPASSFPASNNVIDPSTSLTKPANPSMGNPGPASTLISPSAVPINSPANAVGSSPAMGMPAPRPPTQNFFQRYMMFRALEMMDFF